MKLTSLEIKNYARSIGADLIGIASIDRFENAPKGHHPGDIMDNCKSVMVCALKIPAGSMHKTATTYFRTMQIVHHRLDVIAYKISLFVEEHGYLVVPVPSDDPYMHYDKENQHGSGDLSHKHAARAAGLGTIGKNSILITPQYGNKVHLVSMITDADLEPDPLLKDELCIEDCNLCIEACPVNAIGPDFMVNQKKCRTTIETLPRGYVVESCWNCRKACIA